MADAPTVERSHRRPPLAINQLGVLDRCRWCAEPTGGDRPWHPACGEECRALGDTVTQRAEVIARDGMICGICSQPSLILEVEHRVPLWAVAGLPLAERRAFYTTANLQLAHPACHAKKTIGEAAARAEMKRRAGAPLRAQGASRTRSAKADADTVYRFCGSPRDSRYHWPCKVEQRGPKGGVVVIFADGHRQVAHRINLRREKAA